MVMKIKINPPQTDAIAAVKIPAKTAEEILHLKFLDFQEDKKK